MAQFEVEKIDRSGTHVINVIVEFGKIYSFKFSPDSTIADFKRYLLAKNLKQISSAEEEKKQAADTLKEVLPFFMVVPEHSNSETLASLVQRYTNNIHITYKFSSYLKIKWMKIESLDYLAGDAELKRWLKAIEVMKGQVMPG